MAATAGGHTLNLMACVRESSPPQDAHAHSDQEQPRNETKRRRFHPFRGLRRMFRRKVRHSGSVMPTPGDTPVEPTPIVLDSHRSRSTSELLAGDEPNKRRSGTGLYAGHSGLSVSHDSVFTAEHRSDHSSSEELDTAQSSSSLSIQQIVLPGVKAELFDAVRRRRGGGHGRGDTSEEDEDLGLPRSPCNSPTTVDVLLEKGIKENAGKSHSTCSDGSLLSMGSSEMDEDSFGGGGEHSRHSSKLSLHDRKIFYDNDSELDLGISATPLSHSAARHKMSVRPKRTHGAPRRRRPPQLSVVSPLPTTPEVNEESLGRGSSPEYRTNDDLNPELNAINTEPLENIWLPTDNLTTTETQLKSSSLPPGLALSSELPGKLARSRSSASKNIELSAPPYKRNLSTPELDSATHSEVLSKVRELFGAVGEEDEEEERMEEKKKEESFFGRLLSRRSGKKKKEKMEEDESKLKMPEISTVPKRIDDRGRYANERTYETHSNRSKGGIRARQRVEPINLPPSPEPTRKNMNRDFDSFPEPIFPPPSAIKTETSVNRMHISYSASPPKPTWPEGSVYAKPPQTETKIVDYVAKTRDEELELKPKLRVGGLTSYQQKITSMNDNYDERDYSSLIHTSSIDANLKNNSMLKKSKSFRDNVDLPLMENDNSSMSCGFGDYFQYRNGESRNSTVIQAGFNSILTPDSLEVNNTSYSTTKPFIKDRETVFESPEKASDSYKGIFTKNVFITTRSVIKETKTRQECLIKKSSSLESISSIDAFSSPLGMTTKSSSTESISSLTRQTTTSPISSAGISITQTVSSTLDEQLKKVDSSCKILTQSCSEENRGIVAPPICVNVVTKPMEVRRDALSSFPDDSEILVDDLSARSQAQKRESRISQGITHVPEFLRVQLNPVENKPASNLVLSTSAKIEMPKPDDHLKLRNTIISSPVEQRKEVVECADKAELKEKSDEPQVSLLGLRIKKSSREEQFVIGEKLKTDKPVEVFENFSVRSQDKIQKLFEEKVEQIPVPKPRSISSLQTPLSPVNKFAGVPFIGSPVKPFLKKATVGSLDEEGRKDTKRQLSNDNIRIVEKETTKEAIVPRKSVSSENDPAEKPCGDSDLDFPEVVLRKKNSVKDFGSRSEDDRRTSGEESPDVTLRKKSRDFSQRREEEPELLKVFARRSLKIKDTDTEAIGQQIARKEAQDSEQATKSRDSDKENEGDSPKEERKKPLSKEPLVESKHRVEESCKVSTIIANPPRLPYKYQRSMSAVGSLPIQANESNGLSSKENNPSPDKRHRKSVPDGPNISEKFSHRWTNIHKDIEIDVTNTEVKKTITVEPKKIPSIDAKSAADLEDDTPRFKRIQQRKEEWELRAQQAAKKNLP